MPGKLTIDIKGAGGCSISEGGSMANLITGGLSIALMSAVLNIFLDVGVFQCKSGVKANEYGITGTA